MPPSRFSTKDVAKWRERLLHAKRIWIAHGIIGTSAPSPMRISIEMYRGNHWKHLGDTMGLFGDDLITANKIFTTGNSLVARNAARNPEVRVLARSQTAQDTAGLVEHLLRWDLSEIDAIRPMNRALADHLFAPLGIVRHGFSPKEEVFDDAGNRIAFGPQRPDRPWIRRKPLWDVLFDPRCESLEPDGGCRWVAFRDVMTLDQITKNPKMVKRRELRPDYSSEFEDMLPTGLRDRGPDDDDRVEVYTVYEIESRTWFQLTLDGAGDLPLRDPEPWPLPWEFLPVNALAVNEQMDSPLPIALLDQVIPSQIELNRVRTMMSRMVRNIRRITGVNTPGGVDEDEFQKMVRGDLVEFFKMKGNASDIVANIQSGGFPQELLLFSQMIETDIREASGQSQMDRAQRINVNSATEAANVQAGSDTLSYRIQSAFEKFAGSVIRTYMAARRATMTEQEIVPVLGAQDAARAAPAYLSVDPAVLADEYDYQILPGSMLAPNPDRDAQQALADIQAASMQPALHDLPYLFTRYWQARGVDVSQAMTSPQERAQHEQELQRMQQMGTAPESQNGSGMGGGVDPSVAAFGPAQGSA